MSRLPWCLESLEVPMVAVILSERLQLKCLKGNCQVSVANKARGRVTHWKEEDWKLSFKIISG